MLKTFLPKTFNDFVTMLKSQNRINICLFYDYA